MKRLLLFVLLSLAFVRCAKDNIVLIDSVETNDSDDDIANTVFTQSVDVAFSTDGDAVVSGVSDDFTVTVNGNDVTIVYAGEAYVMYKLSGTTEDGCFKLYSDKRQGITLNNLSMVNPKGAAINVQGTQAEPSKGKRTFVVLNGENVLADGSSYTETPDGEDEKAVLFGEGQLVISGRGSLTVEATGKSGIVSDEYVHVMGGTVTVDVLSSASGSGDNILKPVCIRGKDYFKITEGTLNLTSTGMGGKGISSDGNGFFDGGTVNVTVTGNNYNSGSVSAKGIKCDGNLVFRGSKVVVNSNAHEGIEAKGTLSITAGQVYSHSQTDDAINSGGDLTISGGYVFGYSQGNDGIDANGNCYVKGGVIYAIGAKTPEVAIDANTEERKSLYITGGTLIAIGGLENGTSGNWSQGCYASSSWSPNNWYALTVGSTTHAFLTPSTGGSSLVVSGASMPTLLSGVNVVDGTSCFEGMFYTLATVNGGNNVGLSSYTGGNGGGPGGGHWLD